HGGGLGDLDIGLGVLVLVGSARHGWSPRQCDLLSKGLSPCERRNATAAAPQRRETAPWRLSGTIAAAAI
ncbi:MAG TPA: hypothetical protein VMB84_17805, partial [Stellaceae bacterium]|nr:hypothetical protein [Stellaceae bacterium]